MRCNMVVVFTVASGVGGGDGDDNGKLFVMVLVVVGCWHWWFRWW